VFVQIMEMRSARFDEIDALDEQWRKATEGRRTLRREVLARDRNDPDRYVVLAFFDSAEDAATNSNLPETDEIAGKMAALCDGPITFHDLDIIRER
jgi:hypothetical protein